MNDLSHLCGASMPGIGAAVGPCLLRVDHDGPVHLDGDGVTWTNPEPLADWERDLLQKQAQEDRVGDAEAAVARVRDFCELAIAVPGRVQFANQARVILDLLDLPAPDRPTAGLRLTDEREAR